MIQLINKEDYLAEYDLKLDILYCYLKRFNSSTNKFDLKTIEKWMKASKVFQIWTGVALTEDEEQENYYWYNSQFEYGVREENKKVDFDYELIDKIMPVVYAVRLLDASKYKEISFEDRMWEGLRGRYTLNYLSRAHCAMHTYLENINNGTNINWEKRFYSYE